MAMDPTSGDFGVVEQVGKESPGILASSAWMMLVSATRNLVVEEHVYTVKEGK